MDSMDSSTLGGGDNQDGSSQASHLVVWEIEVPKVSLLTSHHYLKLVPWGKTVPIKTCLY